MPIPQKLTARIWIRLEPGQKEALESLASLRNATQAAIIRQAITEYLDKPAIQAILHATVQ